MSLDNKHLSRVASQYKLLNLLNMLGIEGCNALKKDLYIKYTAMLLVTGQSKAW